MDFLGDTFFLILNASILWGVVAGLLTWLLRFKSARPLKALWRGVCTPVMLLGQHNARA